MGVLCRAEQGPRVWRSGRQTAVVTECVLGHGAKPGDPGQKAGSQSLEGDIAIRDNTAS